jgi:hypothetical protein
LIAVALGSADYNRNEPGLISANGFTFWSALVIAAACALGAAVTGSQLRRADVAERGVLRVAPLAPAVVAIGIAVNGLSADAGLGGLLVVAISATVGVAAGSWFGSHPN